MASNLDTAILLGKETTYGTAATLTNAFEGQADSWKREQEYLESVGFRGGMETKRHDRRKTINLGGNATLEFDVLNKGFGFLAQAMFGSSAVAQEAATTAYKQTHTSTTTPSGVSYTVQVQRVTTGGTVVPFTHYGSLVTGWSLSQEVSGLLMASIEFDFQNVDKLISAGTPQYPTGADAFDWTQSVVTVDGASLDAKSLELTADLGLKTDMRYLRGSALKKKPQRTAVPDYMGTMDADFDSSDIYDLYVSGEIVPIVFTWTGANIESTYDYELVVTLPACQITGESPEASLAELTAQPISFTVLDNGTDPAVTLEYTSTDTAV